VARCDERGRYTFVNDAYCRTFGLRREELIGRLFTEFIHPDDLAESLAALAAADQPALRAPLENRQRTAQGWRWFAWEGSAIRDEHGRIVELQGVGRDVTERRAADEALRESLAGLRRSEERLRLLAQRQSQIREEERKRLGFDLHDNVCQELVGIAILIETLSRRLAPVPPPVVSEFQRVVRYLHELVEHLRVLARDMRPMLLRDLGLEGSLRSLADGMTSATTRVSAEFPTAIPRFDEDIELAVYRIAQEALANAARHAHAQAIVVTLTVAASRLCLVVRDDGRGFDAEPGTHAAALGLVSMRERALALGGVFEVVSAPGRGTVVRLECPLVSRAVA
jgi:two-component system, NarL family, sensor histidine kinase UhpB